MAWGLEGLGAWAWTIFLVGFFTEKDGPGHPLEVVASQEPKHPLEVVASQEPKHPLEVVASQEPKHPLRLRQAKEVKKQSFGI